MATKEDVKKLKKEDIYPLLDAYYQSIGRTNPPHFRTYTLEELQKKSFSLPHHRHTSIWWHLTTPHH